MQAMRVIICAVMFFIFNLPAASAQGSKSDMALYYDYGFKEWGVFSGFQWGNLIHNEDYEAVPLMLRLGFDLRPVMKSKSDIPWEFLIEPFINTLASPTSGAEMGTNFLVKCALPVNNRLYPYLEGGCGMIYLTRYLNKQATRFNFTSQIGAGITYFFTKSVNFSLSYRYRHVSNASIKRPNRGIENEAIICGVSFLY
jgi:opacity protein-like surface antigen